MTAPAQKQPLIIILGPTASGKTALSIRLAKAFDSEIISADSRQVYRGLDIGTEKVNTAEMRGIPHHLIDIIAPDEAFSAADFKHRGEETLRTITTNGHVPIITGGTGFYIDVLLGRIHLPGVPENPRLREKLEHKTADELLSELEVRAPERAQTIERDNKRRLIRALEIHEALGYIPEPASGETHFAPLWIGIDLPDAKLRERIRIRTAAEFESGLLNEIRDIQSTYTLSEAQWREFGFAYTIGREVLSGALTQDVAIQKLTEKTWQYARRQRTYFRRNEDIEWFHPDDYTSIEMRVRAFLTGHHATSSHK